MTLQHCRFAARVDEGVWLGVDPGEGRFLLRVVGVDGAAGGVVGAAWAVDGAAKLSVPMLEREDEASETESEMSTTSSLP